MKGLQRARWFRLATKPDGIRMRCDENGTFWGPVSLFTRIANAMGRRSWVPRAVSELNRELTALSGLPIDLAAKMNGLNAVARALNGGNIALAQVAMLNLHLPDLPDLRKAAASEHLFGIALHLWESGILKSAEFEPTKHPRWPRGAPASQGGRFRAANDNDQVSSEASNVGDSPIVVAGLTRHERCINKCLHLLKSPSGDLQSSEFRKCYGECMGRL
jgi:hypothetical protein